MAIKYPFIVNAYASFQVQWRASVFHDCASWLWCTDRACAWQDDIHLYLVLEYVIGGEFFTHLRKVGIAL